MKEVNKVKEVEKVEEITYLCDDAGQFHDLGAHGNRFLESFLPGSSSN